MANSNDKILFSWVATEYDEHERHPDWFWLVGIITAIGIILSLIFMNFLLAIILLLGVVSIFILEKREPDIIEIRLTPRGLAIGSDFYPTASVKSFWVEEDHHDPYLTIHSGRIIFPHIRVKLSGVEPDEIRRALLPYLPEIQPMITFVEQVAERLGF